MHDSITMAEVGSIVNVSGNRMATPFGPPSPGSTPTKMPSTRPTIIKDSVFQVRRTAKPWTRSEKASMASSIQQGFKRPLRHDHVERYVEGNEHDHRKYEAGEQRLPESYAAHHPHEARDQQEARHVEPEPLREQAEKECRDE